MRSRSLQYVLIWISFLFITTRSDAQSYAFGIKGGSQAGLQQWDGRSRSLIFKPHALLFIESAEEGESYSLYCEAGYHQRGSTQRNRRWVGPSGNLFDAPNEEYIFNNVSLQIGAKSKKDLSDEVVAYYGLGIRGEYTLFTNFDIHQERIEQVFGPNVLVNQPLDEFVRKWNYGITVLGGFEWHFSDVVAGLAELRVNPDFSAQYQQPPIANAYDPYTGNTRTFQEQKAVNISIELTFGLRFLRRIIYID